MSDREPELTNSGLTDPSPDPDATQSGTGPATATGSTPYGGSPTTATGIPATTTGCAAMIADLAPPTNCGAFDVALMARAAAIGALMESDAPIVLADDLAALVTGAALKATVQKRVEQVVKHGYSPASDLMLPPGLLITEAIDHAQRARAGIATDDFARTRDELAAVAALCWAAIDRLDGER